MVSRVTDDKNITLCGSILTLLPVIFVINILLLQFMTKQNPTHEGLGMSNDFLWYIFCHRWHATPILPNFFSHKLNTIKNTQNNA